METKLSVWSAYYIDMGPEDAVLEFKKHGYTCSELSDEHGLELLRRGEPRKAGARFREFMENEGFEMPQGHLWLSCKLCSDADAAPMLLKWLELYEAIGVKNAVLHCDGIAGEPGLSQARLNERNLEKLREIQAGMQGMKIRICLENLVKSFNSSQSLMWLLDRLDPEKFGICLDTGHLNMCRQTQADFIHSAGGRLHALHIADNEGETDQHMMPFGRGSVNFDEVVRALREVDYHGLFNLEIPGERNAPLKVRGYKLEYIRKCYEYMLKADQ